MLGKTPLWKDLLIDFAKGAETTSLICFIAFVGTLLGPALFLILKSEIMSDISSSVVGVMKNFLYLDLRDSLYNTF